MERALQDFVSFLNRHEKFVITTHESPDPDGIGAEVAFYNLLIHLGKKPIIVNADKTPDKYRFIDYDKKITIFDKSYVFPEDISDYGIVILDTNDYSNIGTVYFAFKNLISDVFIIDHHSKNVDDVGFNYINPRASSTSEIIFQIIEHFKAPIPFKSALGMYSGMLFDTGSFRYPKTSPSTFMAAAKLVEVGVSPTWIYEVMYETYSVSSLMLKSRMLSTMEFHFGGRLVLMHLTPEMLIETGGIFSEGEININIPLTVKDVYVSVLIKKDIEGPLKVSMRTKGDLNVADIALSRKGGGHKNAAGYKSYLSWEETRTQVLDDISKFFPPEEASSS
jgi:bifunctional oligoribonuclease and PAP phosphatase NrnA